MGKVINIDKAKKKEDIKPLPEYGDFDRLIAALYAALHSAKESRLRPQYKERHLLNCRDAIEKASFYIQDEIENELDDGK